MSDYVITRADGEDLQHFGIKGQKWGVRRFENEDGTLTEAGKKRYTKAEKLASEEKISGKQMTRNAIKRAGIGASIGGTIGGLKATQDSIDALNKHFDQKYTEIPRDLNEAMNKGTFSLPGKGRIQTWGKFTDGTGGRFESHKVELPDIDMTTPKGVTQVAKFTSKLLNAPSTVIFGTAIGAGVGALGSVTVDKLHNVRIDKARKFVDQYSAAYKKTMEKENNA